VIYLPHIPLVLDSFSSLNDCKHLNRGILE
jgi:hypothetical protein